MHLTDGQAASAVSSTLGSRPWSCSKSRETVRTLFIVSIALIGIRIVWPW
jgi:hypothetical protein